MKRLLAFTAFALLACPLAAGAQKYPEKTIRLVVAFPTGAAQLLGLLVADKLKEAVRQPVVPDFRTGAAGNVAAEHTAKSAPDGYTILLTSGAIAVSPSLSSKLGYDPFRDLAPVTTVASVPNVLVVHPSVPAKTLQELATLARRNPGKLNFGSSGVGGTNHLGSELFRTRNKLEMVHVPYKSAAIAMNAMLSGEVDMAVSTVPGTIPLIRAGRVRGLAVLAPDRVAALPQLPTSAEAGMPDVVVITWYGLFMPAAVKPDIIERVHSEVVKFMHAPDTRAQLAKVEVDVKTMTPAEFGKFMRDDANRWARVVKDANVRAE
ncbi:MAG: Bug family tripartite tricarboxylate transporter substrate binding protein [Burkholderiales bacterium]